MLHHRKREEVSVTSYSSLELRIKGNKSYNCLKLCNFESLLVQVVQEDVPCTCLYGVCLPIYLQVSMIWMKFRSVSSFLPILFCLEDDAVSCGCL